MGFSQAEIDLVRDRTDIVEVISEYVRLKKTGRNFVGLCPFHSEKTPSFSVSREKQMYYCFGCGEGGTVFNFLMKKESIAFPEAVEELGRRAGLQLDRQEDSPERKRIREEKELFFQINSRAREYFIQNLQSGEGKPGREYLDFRKIGPETRKTFSLGYARPEWSGLREFLSRQGMNLALAEKLGLLRSTREGRIFDRFRNRIVFPIEDVRGRVVGFGGRLIKKPAETGQGGAEPVYLNSPESPIFSKGRNLYGLAPAREAIREKGWAVVVEGYFDLISLHQAGIKEVVATLGTALTAEQVSILRNYGEKVVAIFDGDEAGRKAAWRALGLFLEAGVTAEGVLLPQGIDPDSFIQSRGKDQMQALIEQGDSLLSLFVKDSEARNGRSVAGRVKTVDESLPFVLKVQDPIGQSLYLQEIAERVGVDEIKVRERARILKDRRTYYSAEMPEAAGEQGGREQQLPPLEKMLMEVLMLKPTQLARGENEMEWHFSHPGFQELSGKIGEIVQAGQEVDPAVLLDRVENREIKSWLSLWAVKGSELESLGPEDKEKVIKDCLRRIRLVKLKEEQKIISGQIAAAEREGKGEDIRRLLLEKQGLILKKKSIEKEIQEKGGHSYGG